MNDSSDFPYFFSQKAEARLSFLYGPEQADQLMSRLKSLVLKYRPNKNWEPVNTEKWDENDVALITYGDSIKQPDKRPLVTLYEFVELHLKDFVNILHILPYFPFSSDDGFSVIDYREVNPDLGNWDDIRRISSQYKLMTDLVINHVSRENLWFIDYLNNKEPGCHYFIQLDPDTDVSAVVRPRNTPLLSPIHTHRGLHHVWTTFGDDQIDVNFKNADVLFEFLDILLMYIDRGSRVIRLDAIAFLWKDLGTRCLNLRETHEIVKFIRDILELVAPDTILITETNIPNGENVSYFGNSDEAHMVYQFTLPPLLLYTLFYGNSHYLTAWSVDMPRPPHGCTYFNFIASHDGIGLRPAEGILPEGKVASLVDAMHQAGAFVTMKANAHGIDTPYEINIALFDALRSTKDGTDQWHIQRFLCAHTIMLALQGIPAFYIHSLTATPNDHRGVEETGRTRSINRHKWKYHELIELLNNPDTPNARIFHALKHLLSVRRRQTAFHPEASQETLQLGDNLFALWRVSLDKQQKILAIGNVTATTQTVILPEHPNPTGSNLWRELIESKAIEGHHQEIILHPYQTVWLEALD